MIVPIIIISFLESMPLHLYLLTFWGYFYFMISKSIIMKKKNYFFKQYKHLVSLKWLYNTILRNFLFFINFTIIWDHLFIYTCCFINLTLMSTSSNFIGYLLPLFYFLHIKNMLDLVVLIVLFCVNYMLRTFKVTNNLFLWFSGQKKIMIQH